MTAIAHPTPPLTDLYLYLTGSCNLRCRHCWIAPPFATNAGKHLPWIELRKIIERAKPLGLRRVKLTGGEPFLHPEINRILAGLQDMGLAIRMETNATLIGKEEARALREAQVSISISLDGPDASLHDDLRGVAGAFHRTLEGIGHVRQEGLSFELITSLHRKNRDCIVPMLELARKLGARGLKINPINGVARSERMAAQGDLLSFAEVLEVHRSLHDVTVPAGMALTFDIPPAFKPIGEIAATGFCTCGVLNILGVLSDGRASLCGIGTHVRELDFGDLTTQSIDDIWHHPVLESLRANVPDNLGGICGRCIFRSYCLGKCIAQVYYETKELFGGYSFCQWAYDHGHFPATRLVEGRR